jgi:hypothetical protein
LVSLSVVALATVVARLPFVLYGPRFFDSDEAVEGLMARHVLRGEFPFFLWGQRYKGVPEVFLAATTFGIVAPGGAAAVIALKAVTLACFALYACLNFWLLDELFSRRVAWLGALFVIAGPPALVFWSLSGSAEIVMTFIAGTSLLLGVAAWRRDGSRAGLVGAAMSLGFGLWVQQYILYYAAAVVITLLDWSPIGRARLWKIAASRRPAWRQGVLLGLAAVAVLYVVLGLVAFCGLEFSVSLAGVLITVSHPQKMWWIAAALTLIGGTIPTLEQLAVSGRWRSWLAPAVGFLVGFSPAIVGRVMTGGGGAPMPRMDFAGLRHAISPIVTVVVPIVFGYKDPSATRLFVPAWTAVVIALCILVSYIRVTRLTADQPALSRVFHVFLLLTPIAFLMSGAFIDAQSYRYLMPLQAALPVVYAVGIDAVTRLNRFAGAILLAMMIAPFAAQQADWYRRLPPDDEVNAVIRCLETREIRAAFADYWLSYKITFLTNEQLIVAPSNGVDRYPPYTAAVRSAGAATAIERIPAGSSLSSCDEILKPRSATLVPRPGSP